MNNAPDLPQPAGDYWAMSYKGQHIAVHRHNRGWLVYLNHVMQNKLVFCDARSAANFLRRMVDQRSAAAA